MRSVSSEPRASGRALGVESTTTSRDSSPRTARAYAIATLPP
jgi:hypothetical protein